MTFIWTIIGILTAYILLGLIGSAYAIFLIREDHSGDQAMGWFILSWAWPIIVPVVAFNILKSKFRSR